MAPCQTICIHMDPPKEIKFQRPIFNRKTLFYLCWSNHFARNEGRSPKTAEKIAILLVPEQPFRTKWGSIAKNCGKNCDLSRSNPFARNEGRSPKTVEKLRFYLSRSNPFARNEARSPKTEEKLRFYLPPSNPFARNEGRCAKTEVKLQLYLCRPCLCVTASVCKSVWV